jgi:hypothetical protein
MDNNYYSTFIAVAGDCPAVAGDVPQPKNGKATVACVQYDMLKDAPFAYTQEDVLFESWLRRQDLPDFGDDEKAALRRRFFARPQPCLRASPLPKKHGFGFVFDAQGRVALVPMEAPDYARHLADGRLTQLKAMRSAR